MLIYYLLTILLEREAPGIVSQGQVANLINAKPDARRTLLGGSSKYTGLHQRRHEAELRLNQQKLI